MDPVAYLCGAFNIQVSFPGRPKLKEVVLHQQPFVVKRYVHWDKHCNCSKYFVSLSNF